MSTICTEHSAASHSVQTSAVQPPEFCNACIKQVEVEEREEGLEEEEEKGLELVAQFLILRLIAFVCIVAGNQIITSAIATSCYSIM